jgi:hypothetical protein
MLIIIIALAGMAMMTTSDLSRGEFRASTCLGLRARSRSSDSLRGKRAAGAVVSGAPLHVRNTALQRATTTKSAVISFANRTGPYPGVSLSPKGGVYEKIL